MLNIRLPPLPLLAGRPPWAATCPPRCRRRLEPSSATPMRARSPAPCLAALAGEQVLGAISTSAHLLAQALGLLRLVLAGFL